MFHKILIANRGEIAQRVIRTCRRLGIRTVAVYSDADKDAGFVRAADEAYRIGPPPSTESYLDIHKIIDAARESGAAAIHPGYGFLSENPDFVEACERAGRVFIGPTAASMRALAGKLQSRNAMSAAGMPIIPGSDGVIETPAQALAAAETLGYPVLVKADFGGGGIGMTVVEEPAKLEKALAKAAGRAERAFKRGEIYLEKVIPDAHHIEVQVLADNHGEAATVFERECSAQRRHQKVIEETPSPFADENLRRDMFDRVRAAAKAVGYRNAGTFECLVDGNRNWYFLEVNKRLQVEHPVTEMVTGLDLVEQQIRLAAGEPISYGALHPRRTGHAIEARIYAEDPAHKFLPQPGKITRLAFPYKVGVRFDSGVESGSEVTTHYDPLLAKVTAHGSDRTEAMDRLATVLEETVIEGITTNREFLIRILKHPVFRAGRYTTHFIEDYLDELLEGL